MEVTLTEEKNEMDFLEKFVRTNHGEQLKGVIDSVRLGLFLKVLRSANELVHLFPGKAP